MVFDETLKLFSDFHPIHSTKHTLRQASGLNDLETLKHGWLTGDQLQQKTLGLGNVLHPAVLSPSSHLMMSHHAPLSDAIQRLTVPHRWLYSQQTSIPDTIGSGVHLPANLPNASTAGFTPAFGTMRLI